MKRPDATWVQAPQVGSVQLDDYLAAQDKLPHICEAIGAGVRRGFPPSLAIARVVSEHFPSDPTGLSAVDHFTLGMLSQLACDYLKKPAGK